MKMQYIDKFEYKYVQLYSSLNHSIEELNEYGKIGWELFELETPKSTGEQYKALLKRKIIEVET